MTGLLVISECRAWVGDREARAYDRVRARLEAVAGFPVEARQYEDLTRLDADAVVLSGSFAPWDAHVEGALARLGDVVAAYPGPVLGICAGMQLQARFAGGTLGPAASAPPTGFGPVDVLDDTDLLRGLPARVPVYKHHTDEIVAAPPSFRVLARSEECAIEAIADEERPWWGTQFHPEEFDRLHPHGEQVLANFFRLAT
jgi:GMP synthase-like glutamine amidotransferase